MNSNVYSFLFSLCLVILAIIIFVYILRFCIVYMETQFFSCIVLFLAQLFYSFWRLTDKYNLSIFDAKTFFMSMFHPRTYLVFKKCDFLLNPYFWNKTNLNNYYYFQHCNEKLTVRTIDQFCFTLKTDQLLRYLKRFCMVLTL